MNTVETTSVSPHSGNAVLSAGQLKCDTCQFNKTYRTGYDDYPPCTTIGYCSKGHWENGAPGSADKIDVWFNCEDFLPCT
jgi:hypothetical protein